MFNLVSIEECKGKTIQAVEAVNPAFGGQMVIVFTDESFAVLTVENDGVPDDECVFIADYSEPIGYMDTDILVDIGVMTQEESDDIQDALILAENEAQELRDQAEFQRLCQKYGHPASGIFSTEPHKKNWTN